MANQYQGRQKHEKARQLYQYDVENFSHDMYAMWSQVEIIYSHIREANDVAADEAFDKLLAVFSKQPTLPKEIYQIADEYGEAGRYDKADQLYQHVLDNCPNTEHAILSQMGVAEINVLSLIDSGNDTAAQEALDNLIADFNDHPGLPEVVFVVGEQYYYKAFDDPKKCIKVKSEEYLNKAKDIWERIVAQWPESQSIGLKHASYFSAVCYRRLGEYENAIRYYQKVVDNWPNYLYAWSAQSLIPQCYEKLRNAGSLSESEANLKIEQAYEAVVEEYSDCPLVGNACLKLGQINFKKGQWVLAAQFFELFLQENAGGPRQLRVLYDLGRAYEKMGEFEQAAQVYGEFIKIADPTDPRIKRVEARLEELEGVKK
ncbi:Cell division coordinator CpoB [subsurface metagenome]